MIRVALLTEIISPYRVPVFNHLARDPRIELRVLFLAETEDRRSWRVPRSEIRFPFHVLPGRVVARTYQRAPLFLNPGVISHLRRGRYDVIICGGYQHPTYWLTLLYCKLARKRALLWTESNRRDTRSGNRAKNVYKRLLIGLYDGYIAAGSAQKEYLSDFGIDPDRIWTAPNAVDNHFFARRASAQRPIKEKLKDELGIKGQVVLYVGRLLDAKGIPHLLQALERVTKKVDATLVIVGDGPDESKYRVEAGKRGLPVYFAGFQQQEELSRYYGMADIFVFPTESDQWGLAINEAMASGLPVIVSSVAGAASDLVRDGYNGLLFEPGDVPALAAHIERLLTDRELADRMGQASQRIIEAHSPERCAAGFVEAIIGVCRRGEEANRRCR
ncbi:MAG TPA: glycosyltransferase family 4 protein [Chloroflexia bacterium]|nr:glycosyltransferase family 4 protein [Chloroflexia bacterium]